MTFAAFLDPHAAAETPAAPGPLDDYWYSDGGYTQSSAAGMNVTPETAQQISAVFACVRVLADTISSLPLVLYRRTNFDGGKERAYDHPLWSVLHDGPNSWQTASEFWSLMITHACLRGWAVAQIVSGPRGSVDQIIPRHPDRVKPVWLEDGSLAYEWSPAHGPKQRLLSDEVFVVRWLTSDGITPVSPIGLHRQSLGLAKAYETHGAKSFTNEARPGRIMLEHPGKLKPDAAANLRNSFERIHAGPVNWHRTVILEEGMKASTLGMTNEDAQFLEGRNYQNADIARIYKVPLHMIGDLTRSTNNNIEHQSLDFIRFTMLPWLTRIEQVIARDVISDPRMFVKFNVDGLARGDAAARAGYYASGINAGWLTRNEARRLEDLDPLEGLDEPLQPLNMATTGATATPTPNAAPADPAALVPSPAAPTSNPKSPPPVAPPPPDNAKPATITPEACEELILDAAGRIASRETIAIGRRIDKAAADKPKFVAWLDGWAASHVDAVSRTLTPLKIATDALCETTIVASHQVANRLVADFKVDPLPDWKAWSAARAGVVADMLRKEFVRA